MSWRRNAPGYRLPTEAEWEYACRAGSTTAFCNGPLVLRDPDDCHEPDANLERVAWYCYRSAAEYGRSPVRTKEPNAWGLYDMHGNAREWCWDVFGDYPDSSVVDPEGAADPGDWRGRSLRGGAYDAPAKSCRSAARAMEFRQSPLQDAGLRVARNAD